MKNITKLAAATGWVAVYSNPAVSDEEDLYPLVAWAVKTIDAEWAEPGEQRIVGLVYIIPGDGVVDAEDTRSIRGHPFLAYQYRPGFEFHVSSN